MYLNNALLGLVSPKFAVFRLLWVCPENPGSENWLTAFTRRHDWRAHTCLPIDTRIGGHTHEPFRRISEVP